MSSLAIDERIDDPLQMRFLVLFKSFLNKRGQYYEQMVESEWENVDDDDDDDLEEEYEINSEEVILIPIYLKDDDVDWRKVLLITGKPGTRKTHCLKQAI